MKKLLSLVLALTLALSLSVTAFATSVEGGTGTDTGSTNTFGPNDKEGKSTSVTYGVDAAYTVTIPASVTISGTSGTNVTVSAENVKVAYGKQVVVRLTGINVTTNNDTTSDSEFKVKTTEGAELKYTVKKGDTAVTTEEGSNTVLTVNPADTTSTQVAQGSTQLTFALADTVKYAGTYSGTVTFTVSVEDVSTIGDEQP